MSKEKTMLSELKVGEVFSGESGRKYKVLKQEEGKTKVITLDLMAENKVFDEDTTNYKESELNGFIEGELQPIIEADFEEDNLVEHEVDLTTVDMQKDYGTCTCKVRPITFDEAREHNAELVNKDLPDWYWTCTPWSTEERGWKYNMAVFCPSGGFYWRDCYNCLGVRPVCILKSNIFVSKED